MKIKKIIAIAAITSVTAFSLLTLWDVTVNGILETPDLNVDHFVSGAGGLTILARYGLGLGSVVFLLIWLPLRIKLKPMILKLCVAILVSTVFIWSAIGLERYSSDYSEEQFAEIVETFSTGKSITSERVLTDIGTPLVSGKQKILIESRPHSEAWLYSYMPSCGFGWKKRVLYFDSENQMVSYLSIDEP